MRIAQPAGGGTEKQPVHNRGRAADDLCIQEEASAVSEHNAERWTDEKATDHWFYATSQHDSVARSARSL